MPRQPHIHDIPGTYVFDKEHSRKGYRLNMFCMSLNEDSNRQVFRADEAAYLRRAIGDRQQNPAPGLAYRDLL